MTDPTNPTDWPARQALGRAAFQLRYGVLGFGLPIGVAFDLVLLFARRNAALFFSPYHAIQLLLVMMTVGMLAGLIAGRILWRVGKRRYGDSLLTKEFFGEGDAASIELRPKADPSLRSG